MSNFIYNDNFNGGDREPIRFDFSNRNKNSTRAILVGCIISSVISVLLGCLIGFWLVNNLGEAGKGSVETPNIVYTNTILQSTEPAPVTSGDSSRANVIEKIKDSVVEIRTEAVVSHQNYIKSGAGSGVIIGKYESSTEGSDEISESGYYVITNAHVVEDAVGNRRSEITVILTDGTEYKASLIESDVISDIAVLKFKESKELKCATVANSSYKLRVGDEVMAIGNPLGQLGGTVTNGYVSALDREIQVDGITMRLLQTDAPINPGNSGGGLFNLRGELVGIVNAKSTGTDIEGLGFAIPIDSAYSVFEDIINLGYVQNRPTVFAEFKTSAGLNSSCAEVTSVLKRDKGDNSSQLKVGDKIRSAEIDGKRIAITSASQLESIISKMEIGSTLTLIVSRGFANYEITVTVFEFYI